MEIDTGVTHTLIGATDWVTPTEDGVGLLTHASGQFTPSGRFTPSAIPPRASRELLHLLCDRDLLTGCMGTEPSSPEVCNRVADRVAVQLVSRRSERWREAVDTALRGDWCAPLWQDGHLPQSALGTLKDEARAVHRALVPLWRHGPRFGRVLSLDAALGDGLSLHDLVASDVDLLARVADGVFEDERLNAVLRLLAPAERQVVIAYAAGEGTTWTEAAAAVGATAPQALGERVRRKAKRLATEQRRRAAQQQAPSASRFPR